MAKDAPHGVADVDGIAAFIAVEVDAPARLLFACFDVQRITAEPAAHLKRVSSNKHPVMAA